MILSCDFSKKLREQLVFKEIPVKCTINTTGSGPIAWTRPIRNRMNQVKFDELVNDLEQRGIVEPSKSTWLNPVVLVEKKSGEMRFCVDFRRLNKLVRLDGYELPNIQQLISKLGGKKWFTVIDLKDGFFQIPIEHKDKEKTTFFTGTRLMQFRKMPQGFKNSPAIFKEE